MNPVTNTTALTSFDGLVALGTEVLVPLMCLGLLAAITLRMLIYFTIKRQAWFTMEFEKRVGKYLNTDNVKGDLSFFVAVKKIIERTYYEMFETRAILNRRRTDVIMSLSDRVFLIKQGIAWTVRDILKQVKYLKFEKGDPKFLEITKNTFQNNPCFSRLFGLVSSSGINDVLNILPGMFIIAGIFGTFLGIMKALPELSQMNLADPEQSKIVMDHFLFQMSFAMSKSAVGIFFSVVMTFANTIFSPEKVFSEAIDRFNNTIELMWNRSDNNRLPSNLSQFDEHKDPIEALAEQSLDMELSRAGFSDRDGKKPQAS